MLLLLACRSPNPAPPEESETAQTGIEETHTGETGTEDPPAPTAETGTQTDPCAPAIEIGSGVTAHQPLAAGDPITLVHGPQGGWHVDTSASVIGTGQTVSVAPTLTRISDGALIAGDALPQFIAMSEVPPCGWQFYGVRAYLSTPGTDPVSFVCSLNGEAMLLSMIVEDLVSGTRIEEQIEVRAAADPQDECP